MNENLNFSLRGEPVSVSEDFLRKYDQMIPRYTSYPTAPEWQSTFPTSQWEQALAESTEELSIYIHIPFCQAACYYCACNFVVNPRGLRVDEYLQALDQEFGFVSKRLRAGQKVRQLHLGGGTPTFLTCQQIQNLWDILKRHFSFSEQAELGIEVDPRVTSPEQLTLLRSLGFNRLSLGVQDFDPAVQQAVNRIQSVEMIGSLLGVARQLGYASVNFDLIYGLPGQSLESFQQTIKEVIALSPDRIALFNYAHLPSLRPFQKAHIDESALPAGALKFAIFVAALESLTAAGYEYIGLDHFAKPADELCLAQKAGRLHRNFQGYTTEAGCDLLGFGLSSISSFGGIYTQNEKKLGPYLDYYKLPGKLIPPFEKGCKLTPEDLIRRELIGEILCHGELHYKLASDKYKLDFEQYFALELAGMKDLETDGLLELTETGFKVKALGRIFLRNVAARFDAYLAKNNRLFSRSL